jgi:enediyne biosynthesis protein E4
MGSVLTSSTSKFLLGPLLGGLLLFPSCSSQKSARSADEEGIDLSLARAKELQPVKVGPTVDGRPSFLDRTSDYGLSDLSAVAMNAVDLNLDGFTDLVLLPSYYSRPKFLIFNPQLKKFEPWKHDPLPNDFKASFMVFVDINKDRITDILVGVLNQKSEVSKIPLKLYVGNIVKGQIYFQEDKTFIPLPAEPTSSVTVLDYNLDGWLDIFVSNWYDFQNSQYLPVADRLLKNNRGKFEDVSLLLTDETKKLPSQLFPPEAKPTYGASTCDIDQNGYPDILTISSSGHRNKLWMNLKDNQSGDRYFSDVGLVSGYAADPNGSLLPTGGGRTFASACTDYNDDGIMDIFLGEMSHAYDNDSIDKSSILTGSRETYPPFFIRTEYLSDADNESWNQGDRRASWMDMNFDGRVDLIVDNSGFPPHSRLVAFEQDETHAFQNMAADWGIDIVNPVATIVLDLNQDGKPDLISAQNSTRRAEIKHRLYAFENHMPQENKKSLRIHLQGIKSNSSATGAMVMLYTTVDGRKKLQRRWVESFQGGLPSQNESGVLFGISPETQVVGVKVRWPYMITKGNKSGEVLEKLYPVKLQGKKSNFEFTLCEEGRVIEGKGSCQF